MAFNGLGMNLGNLSRLSDAESRSISSENPAGGKGAGAMTVPDEKNFARKLGRGWKAAPNTTVEPGQTQVLADIHGSGAIQQMWITPTGTWRNLILRMTWDDAPTPAVECPLGDFFACGWNRYAQFSSLAVCVNPGSALNCYWEMPFRRRAHLTLTNIGETASIIYYQINYTLTEVPDDAAYFHAQFRRVNPVPYKVPYIILDGVKGRGQYVGTYLAWGAHSPGWWGEGEIKFYLDGDGEFPTICGTGTEDYFGGSYNFDLGKEQGGYREFTTPYTGLQVIRPDGLYASQQRFGMYRWHVMDPVRFKSDLRVTIQDLGIEGDFRRGTLTHQAREDDVASVAYWYQTLPSPAFPPLPDLRRLQI
ncbi:MAG TPA: glycoside hydrolase family 172 protein [Candidatus Binataceae bacterium]|nr:glycoside hydrolase family 172 protein [Candidatus Binataceae bacterium]